ncbi:LysR family transcriptional regulator [Arabiibacter massiliensis]|uniref:LysR family transcriptional regulator n=1 Tax=Arabiibacter massiliensis TaxID=1870985 RepID=UPI0009BAC6A6|nr:LysR family transcriptional regulator [Arabiibacter massiliensis]
MNIKQIKYFVSTVESGSLTAAAKRNFVTVQTISKAMGDLETELGENLFVRKSHGVEPTLFGSAFYREARKTVAEFDKLEAFKQADDREDPSPQSDTLRLGMVAPAFYRFSDACGKIEAFAKRFMGIEASVTRTTAGKGMEGLRTGRLDALMSLGPLPHKDVNCVSVGTIPLGVLMAATHPLRNAETVNLDDLRRYPLLTSEGFSLINDDFVRTFHKLGIEMERKNVGMIEVMRFVVKDQGLIFAAGISALGGMLGGAKLKLVTPSDAYPIPFCLTSLKGCMNPSYFAFEHFMSNGLASIMNRALS